MDSRLECMLKFYLGSRDKTDYASFVDGMEVYYTGEVNTSPSIRLVSHGFVQARPMAYQ